MVANRSAVNSMGLLQTLALRGGVPDMAERRHENSMFSGAFLFKVVQELVVAPPN